MSGFPSSTFVTRFNPKIHFSRPQGRAILDLLTVVWASVIAYFLISSAFFVFGQAYESWGRLVSERGFAFLSTAFLVVGWLYLKGDYHQKIPFWSAAKHLVLGCLAGLLIEGFLLYANKNDVSRVFTFGTWVIAPLLVMMTRAIETKVSYGKGLGISPVVIIGHQTVADNAARIISSDPHLGLRVSSVVLIDDYVGIPDLQTRFPEMQYVLVALSGANSLENSIVADVRMAGLDLIVIPVANGMVAGMEVRYLLGEESILLIDRMEAVPQLSRMTKRLFDVTVSTLSLIILGIPMLIVAGLIKRDGGPAIYEHERIGMNGKPFMCKKFRSMAVNSDEMLANYLSENEDHRREWSETRKLKSDPRVTDIGRFIRKSTIDELPQLLNVLKGDMSLVGPRPVTSSELSYYGNTVDYYTSVRPGLTGLWQVSGRSDLSYEQRVRLDTWYVRNWTAWHDLAIILKTVPAVFARKGAY